MLRLLPRLASRPPPSAARPASVEVRLSNFDFTPETIRLRAGEPVVLHLVNSARGGHNFSAPEFFAAASGVSRPGRPNGKVELRGHMTASTSA